MPGQFTARTTYVADRIRRTRWEDRHVIADLLMLEELFSGQRVGGLYMMSVRHGLAPKYSLESVIIAEELRSGRRLSPVEALERLAEQSAARYARQEAERARERTEQEEREHEAYQAWLDAGGLP